MNSTTTARARLPAAATKILRQWHESHYDFPYPSTDDKVQLQQLTGLSDKQISNWFTNTRRRSRSRSSQSSRSGSEHDTSTASSLDRWRHSPPELEHVSLQDIAAAMGSVEIPVNDHRDRALRTSSDPNARDASQTSDSSHDWASDGSTSGSQSNSTVLGSVRNRRRRGRKRPNMTLLRNPTETRIFQCTFCTDAFKTKYDWSRHEASLHLPLDRWICTLSGPRYISEQQRVECCVYCDLENPSDHHLETHRSLECSKKPSVAREFYRKDHLRQHLRQVHRSERFTKAMEGWKSKITEVRSRCGFCDERFQTWPERTDHLAEHFRNGNTMKNWTGARGFEPVVATRVRHSIPPYLINMEAT
ncbi:hypothetical protein BTJ68_11543 [Hortaea werneckii EXF-2000]|uniref:Homeobox domain-containing protein n=1 Tax=Hortaea werneckii EXF-2000 TaxID=1157616 RepID=A0A1Z5T045_HORWE|nr:hypothetical protein BTJ68_11543 [Hortaea werneckii EXF-2000]